MRDFADEVCLRAREVDSELVGSGLQRISSDGELLRSQSDNCLSKLKLLISQTQTVNFEFPIGTLFVT